MVILRVSVLAIAAHAYGAVTMTRFFIHTLEIEHLAICKDSTNLKTEWL